MKKLDKFHTARLKTLIREEDKYTLGEFIREAREIYGYTRIEVSEIVRRGEVNIFQIETDKHVPRMEFLNSVAALYGLPVIILKRKAIKAIAGKSLKKYLDAPSSPQTGYHDKRYGVNVGRSEKTKEELAQFGQMLDALVQKATAQEMPKNWGKLSG
jgi:transcriptional regulator with XRE-family HTH domain